MERYTVEPFEECTHEPEHYEDEAVFEVTQWDVIDTTDQSVVESFGTMEEAEQWAERLNAEPSGPARSAAK